MKRIEAVSVLALVLLLGATCIRSQGQSPAPTSTVTIYGYVTDATGAIVPNATVNLEANEKVVQQTKTDKDGLFTIESRPGDYLFKVAAQGFFTYDITIHLNDSAIIRKHIILNVAYCSPCVTVFDSSGKPIAPRVTITHNTATISGTITDPTGASIPTAIVELDVNKKPVLWITVNGAGHFAANVPPGDYTLRVRSPGFAPYQESIHLSDVLTDEKNIVLSVATSGCGVCVTPEGSPLETSNSSLTSLLPLNPVPPLKLLSRNSNWLRR